MQRNRFDSLFFQRLYDVLLPFAAVLAAFLIGAVLLLLQGVNPLEAYQAMFVGAFGSKNGLSDTLVKAIPLMLARCSLHLLWCKWVKAGLAIWALLLACWREPSWGVFGEPFRAILKRGWG